MTRHPSGGPEQGETGSRAGSSVRGALQSKAWLLQSLIDRLRSFEFEVDEHVELVPMLRHVVIWSMSERHRDELDDLLRELRELPEEIDEIEMLSAGPLLNESRMDAAICVDVADSDALERYRSHPAHQPVLTRLRGVASELVVADYEY